MEFKRHTRQRQAILETLQGLKTHPTASELHELVRIRLPRLSLGTVYRNLEALVREGMVRKLVSGHMEARFDGDLSGHYHVRCVDCGRVADVHGLDADGLESQEVSRRTGFQILSLRLEFAGVCPDCHERRCSLKDRSRAGCRQETPARVDSEEPQP
jgi:Fur family transcriptional regulator, ferric uptake regulator